MLVRMIKIFCALILVVVLSGCSLFGITGEPLNRYFINPREVELKLSYHLEGIKKTPSDNTVTMYEFSEEPATWEMEQKSDEPVLLLYVARQQELPSQRNLEYISIDPPPDKIVSRDIDGNTIEFWDLSDQVRSGKDIVITRHLKFTAYETAFRIDPEKMRKYNPDDPVYRYYTRTQEMVEQTPMVRKMASEIVGDETNPYLKARAIYDWCVNNIDYKYPPNRGLRFCLPRRTGDCGSYSLIFTGLCRSVGIPARVANGHWCCAQKRNYHVWNEFYLPGYGWIPADATDGRITRDNPGKLAGNGDAFYFFGNLDSGRFISSHGTSIQLYPSPPWHKWGMEDSNRNPIFFQTAAVVYANLEIKSRRMNMEIIRGDDVLW